MTDTTPVVQGDEPVLPKLKDSGVIDAMVASYSDDSAGGVSSSSEGNNLPCHLVPKKNKWANPRAVSTEDEANVFPERIRKQIKTAGPVLGLLVRMLVVVGQLSVKVHSQWR